MNKDASIFVAGHNGMLGSAIIRALQSDGFDRIITASRNELDLCDINQVKTFIKKKQTRICYFSRSKSWRYQC